MNRRKSTRSIREKKVQIYLETHPGFLVLTTGPVSSSVIWGFRPSKRPKANTEPGT